MGLFDFFTGTKRPEYHLAPRSVDDVRNAILAVNRPTAPCVIRDGADEGGSGRSGGGLPPPLRP